MTIENTELTDVASQNEASQNETERLTWALVDEQITDEQKVRLGELLETDPAARSVYLQCMQMHGDLQGLFANESAPLAEAPKPLPPTVLSFLQQGLPSFGAAMGNASTDGK